jgi:uncharacterized protein YjbI with pentapeptide repeats
LGKPIKVSFHDLLFNVPVDDTTRRRWLPFSSTLVLAGFSIYEGLNIDDPKKAEWRDYVFRARGRDLKGAILDFASLPKVDFWGAELQGASLRYAQLQGTSLIDAHLQGASLDYAQFQGALFVEAQLQGASLDYAQLQGSDLLGAHLQGASLDYAQLQGAILIRTQLDGASFDEAQLQGASLIGGSLKATSLFSAFLWRTAVLGVVEKPAAIRLPDAPGRWLPFWRPEPFKVQPWSDEAYQHLRKIMDSVPPGALRDQALERIEFLDCANPDTRLASCDSSAAPPPQAAAWRKALEAASVDDRVYAITLAEVLRELVCSGRATVYVVRGVGFQDRLRAAGAAGIDLIDDLTNRESKDCPVSASLTDADRANLLRIKQDATEKPGG